MRRTIPALFLVFALVTGVSTARAQPACPAKPDDGKLAKGMAKIFWGHAQRHFDAGRYKQALSAWLCSYKMVAHPLSLYNIARAAEKAKNYPMAMKYYRYYLDARPDAPEKATVLEKIRLIGEMLKKSMRPTERKPPERRRPQVAPPPPEKPKAPKRPMGVLGIAGWSAVGAGALIAVVGGALGGLAAKAKSDYEGLPEGSEWQADASGPYSDYDKYSKGTWACLSIGAAVLATGVVLVILDQMKGKKERVSIAPSLLRHGAAVTIGGRF